jgi:hypothetical protein
MSAMLLADLALESDPGLPAFFLGRLASLVALQIATQSPIERKALAAAVFAIYVDCLDLGLGNEAQPIIAQLRDGSAPGERLVA